MLKDLDDDDDDDEGRNKKDAAEEARRRSSSSSPTSRQGGTNLSKLRETARLFSPCDNLPKHQREKKEKKKS